MGWEMKNRHIITYPVIHTCIMGKQVTHL